jgi:hypothetical protein
MYGFWILFIIFAIPTAGCFALAIVAKKLYNKYDRATWYEYTYQGASGPMKSVGHFYGDTSDMQHLEKEEYDRLLKIRRKRDFWYNFYTNSDTIYFIGALLLVMSIIFLLFAIILPISAQNEVTYWNNFVDMVNLTLNDADNYHAIGIAGDIIEYNSWLTEALTSQQVWGNWSCYYNIDLSQLHYIMIGQ